MPRIHKSITATILSLLCFMLAAAILLTLTMSGGDKPLCPPPHMRTFRLWTRISPP